MTHHLSWPQDLIHIVHEYAPPSHEWNMQEFYAAGWRIRCMTRDSVEDFHQCAPDGDCRAVTGILCIYDNGFEWTGDLIKEWRTCFCSKGSNNNVCVCLHPERYAEASGVGWYSLLLEPEEMNKIVKNQKKK